MTQTPTPPPPPGWNKTMADLVAESQRGERYGVGWPESVWAREYELSLLPAGTRFPRHGDIYAANAPFPTTLYLSWHAPVTTDVAYTLPAGTQVRVESQPGDRSLVVNVLPVDYGGLEKAALSRWTRWRPDYGGYHLSLGTHDLNTAFTLVSAGS